MTDFTHFRLAPIGAQLTSEPSPRIPNATGRILGQERFWKAEERAPRNGSSNGPGLHSSVAFASAMGTTIGIATRDTIVATPRYRVMGRFGIRMQCRRMVTTAHWP